MTAGDTAYEPPVPGLRPGDRVQGRYTKWGGHRHHGALLRYLGADEHGHWLLDPVGNHWSGGPATFTSVTDNVFLVPRDRGFTAMAYQRHPEVKFKRYCDIVTATQWLPQPDGPVLVTAVDLDLDVIQWWDGEVFVDDEDEFAEHQVSLDYPAEVIADAERVCREVVAEIMAGAAWSLDSTVEPWRAVAAELPPQAL